MFSLELKRLARRLLSSGNARREPDSSNSDPGHESHDLLLAMPPQSPKLSEQLSRSRL